MKQETVYVGIDVSKTCVDVAVRPTGQKWTISNDESRIGELVSRLKALDPVIVVLESTGGLELPSVTALAAGALPVVIVNPRQVRLRQGHRNTGEDRRARRGRTGPFRRCGPSSGAPSEGRRDPGSEFSGCPQTPGRIHRSG